MESKKGPARVLVEQATMGAARSAARPKAARRGIAPPLLGSTGCPSSRVHQVFKDNHPRPGRHLLFVNDVCPCPVKVSPHAPVREKRHSPGRAPRRRPRPASMPPWKHGSRSASSAAARTRFRKRSHPALPHRNGTAALRSGPADSVWPCLWMTFVRHAVFPAESQKFEAGQFLKETARIGTKW